MLEITDHPNHRKLGSCWRDGSLRVSPGVTGSSGDRQLAGERAQGRASPDVHAGLLKAVGPRHPVGIPCWTDFL